MLFASSAELTISQHLFPKMAYDPMKDLAPVYYASHAALLFSVHPSFPAKSLQEVIALTRAQPGKFSIASAGTGGVQHLAGELLKTAAKVDIVHIPYKGAGPAVIDMVGGQVQMGFTALPSSIQHARSGRLRPIAVTSVKRSEVAPDLPTFTELGFPTVDLVVWRQGKEVPLKLRVGEQEEADKQTASATGTPKKPAEADQPVTSTIEQLGLTLQKPSDQLREKYGLSDQQKGVVVTKVAPNSPAAEKQLQPGDLILEVDQKPVTTPQEVTDIVTKLQQQKKKSVLLFVERQGDPRFAALRLTK